MDANILEEELISSLVFGLWEQFCQIGNNKRFLKDVSNEKALMMKIEAEHIDGITKTITTKKTIYSLSL